MHLGQPINITKTFTISATYCTPSSPSEKTSTVQVLTHGLGFDKSYWDFLDASYSYVDYATKAGYATLSYSRLGNGDSQYAEPYNELQTAIELAILAEITAHLRAGTLCESIPAPEKVVHVGHSFGSLLSNALVAAYPSLSDGLILTGFSHNTTWQRWFEISTSFNLARDDQPGRFGNYSSGYLTWGNKFDNQYAFLKYPYFDPGVLVMADSGKWPFSLGEFLTFGTVDVTAESFTGPVLMISGDSDLIFCGANCTGILDGPDSLSSMIFSAAKPFETYLQPNTGHGMNLHFNATGTYGVITEFLGKNGL